MSKDKHRDKLRMARRMMTKDEIKAGVRPFNSRAWNERVKNKEIKVRNQEVGRDWAKKQKEYEDKQTA